MECIEKHRHFQRGMPASSILNFRYFTCLLDKGHIIFTLRLIVLVFFVSKELTFNIQFTFPGFKVWKKTEYSPMPANGKE